MAKMTSTKKHPTGYVAIRSPDGIQKALARRINRILMDRGEDHHGGQLAALCNAWINAEKWKVEVSDFREIQRRLDELEEMTKNEKKRY